MFLKYFLFVCVSLRVLFVYVHECAVPEVARKGCLETLGLVIGRCELSDMGGGPSSVALQGSSHF